MLKRACDQTAFAEDVRRTLFRRPQSRPIGDAQLFKLQPELTVIIENEAGETEPAITLAEYEEVEVEESVETESEDIEEETDEEDE